MHPAPAVLPRLSHEGPGRNRYDDPWGQYTVRYVAENLTGALLETMARFRPAPEAEALLAGVGGIEDGDVDHPDPAGGVSDWLAAQRSRRLRELWRSRCTPSGSDMAAFRASSDPPCTRGTRWIRMI